MTGPTRLSTIQRWWPALGWAVVILGMSSVPGSRLDDVGFEIPDKLIHGIEYAVLAALAWWAVSARRNAFRAVLLAVLFASAVGALDENYQRLIPERDSSVNDWLADVAGAVIGAGLAAGVRGRAVRDQRRN